MEKQMAEIASKLKALHFTLKKTNEILAKEDREVTERQHTNLTNLIKAVNTLKQQIEEGKFASGESEEDVEEWGREAELSLAEADGKARELKEQMQRMDIHNRDVEEDHDHERSLEFERQLLEQKLQYQKHVEQEKAAQAQQQQSAGAKLPKLKITPFNGSFRDWIRFWSQFKANVESRDLDPTTKFSYLKELIQPKLRSIIDGLPFTPEGYDKAKDILTERYGDQSEIVSAYVEDIINLPHIQGANPAKIHGFYEKLLYSVQSLETLGKLSDVNGHVRLTINKLEGIRGDLVRTDPKWKEWDFLQLVAALHAWTERNPVETKLSERPHDNQFKGRDKPSRLYQAQEFGARGCVFCDDTSHKAVECRRVSVADDRKKILAEKKRCFNCTGSSHRAAECKSKATCQKCGKRHHTSICKQHPAREEQMLTAVQDTGVVHPVVVVNIEGVQCRALLDTGATSSYASAKLLDRLRKKPVAVKEKRIEMLMGTSTRRVEVFKAKVGSISGDFEMEVNLTKVEKAELLTLENPKYDQLLDSYSHLKGVKMDDIDKKPELPVHVILGTSEYARIKTDTPLRIGSAGQPVAEKTRFGWTIISPGQEVDLDHMFLIQTSKSDYEELCRLDVLGIADSSEGDQMEVYSEFKEQLRRSPEGWYETGLPWKGDHLPLPDNKHGSLRRLASLTRRLERTEMTERYAEIIEQQKKEGIVEPAEEPAKGREFYIPHKPVVREAAASTKLRVVYDASARAYDSAPSLNDCLNTGPPLQNLLWGVLVRQRFHPVALAGDIKQAFLQIRIRQEDRDALRFHWVDRETLRVETLRFTRALFGLAPSPFLLGAVVQQHLETEREHFPDSVQEIERSLYVDDLISGRPTVNEARRLKEEATEIFAKGTFQLHKWHSNACELEDAKAPATCGAETYAKQQLGTPDGGDGSLLGVPWDKTHDTISIKFPTESSSPTKRGLLAKVAKIYDPLGLASPVTLRGKLLYRDACDERIAWDTQLPRALEERWRRWESSLPRQVTTVRSLTQHREQIENIHLHAFGDASGQGVGAAVYAVITQASGVSQGLVAAKARIAKRGLTIPRLELVSGHMAVNLVANVRSVLEGFPVTKVHCWLDSTVALHWINGRGEYKQFVSNRVRKIQAQADVSWRHVGTAENPADLASRGGDVSDQELWWHGPEWLQDPERWPQIRVTQPSPASRAEAKATRELFAVAIETPDELDELLQKHELWRVLRVCAWIARFVHNARSTPQNRASGPLTTPEIEQQTVFWTKRAQERGKGTTKFQKDKVELNVQVNEKGVLECRGRLQGHYPIFLPDSALYTRKLVQRKHVETLHGGLSMTMAKIRETYWIPRLRNLARQVIKSCHGCKRFQAVAHSAPPPGNLPKNRTQGTTAYQVIGVDYAGPLRYRVKPKQEGKAYILLYACSLTRGVFLDLMPTLETADFLCSLKRFIARRGRPERIYSDNGRTFVGAEKWVKTVMADEKLQDFLASQEIRWQFNLSRAPWWGGQFERLVGLVKASLFKTIGKGCLTWKELEEVILDVEVALNNRPLSYVEDDVQLPVLTPNALLFVQPNYLPEIATHRVEDPDLRKRAKHLKKCKEVVWKRWTGEYLRALRERHQLKHQGKPLTLKVGDVVIMKSDERNRGKWPLGIIHQLFAGRDGIVRAAKLRAGKGYMERAIQQLYPLELSCDRTIEALPAQLNVEAQEFRPRRTAAAAASQRIHELAQEEF